MDSSWQQGGVTEPHAAGCRLTTYTYTITDSQYNIVVLHIRLQTLWWTQAWSHGINSGLIVGILLLQLCPRVSGFILLLLCCHFSYSKGQQRQMQTTWRNTNIPTAATMLSDAKKTYRTIDEVRGKCFLVTPSIQSKCFVVTPLKSQFFLY